MNEESCDYAVVEFTEECTAVVPLQWITGLPKPGEKVNVLWNDRKEYLVLFLFSGEQVFEFLINAHC